MQNIDYFARCSISSIQGYERDFTHTCYMNFFFILCHVNSRSIKNDKCHTFYVVCRPLFVFCSFSWTKASLTNWSKTVFDFHFLSAKSISRWSSKKKKEKNRCCLLMPQDSDHDCKHKLSPSDVTSSCISFHPCSIWYAMVKLRERETTKEKRRGV